ncbi:hypothetical protein ABDH65_05235 [Heyndrickxia ginsengihumi]|uniref:hypothetical protein n=1 Tax=Heyndrickxia ginsengihumi TaxID=363870 RepID=UPI003D214DCF
MYTIDEISKKLGLNQQIVRSMCEKGRFRDAYQNKHGEWQIPEDNFITTREQDEKAEKILRHIDRKNYGEKDEIGVPFVSTKEVSNYYQVEEEKVISWIKQGHLSGIQVEGQPDKYLVPREEYEYLKSKRESDTTEEELKKLLGLDFMDDWDVEIDE